MPLLVTLGYICPACGIFPQVFRLRTDMVYVRESSQRA